MSATMYVSSYIITILNLAVITLLVLGVFYHPQYLDLYSENPPLPLFVTVLDFILGRNAIQCRNIIELYTSHQCIRSVLLADDADILDSAEQGRGLRAGLLMLLVRTGKMIAPFVMQFSVILCIISALCVFNSIVKVVRHIMGYSTTINVDTLKKTKVKTKTKKRTQSLFQKIPKDVCSILSLFLLTTIVVLCVLGEENEDDYYICTHPLCLYTYGGLKNTIFKPHSEGILTIFDGNYNVYNHMAYHFFLLTQSYTIMLLTLLLYWIALDLICLLVCVPAIIGQYFIFAGNLVFEGIWRSSPRQVVTIVK